MSMPLLQRLEHRLCLTATLQGSTLVVTGTGADDVIVVQLFDETPDRLEVKINDAVAGNFDPGAVELVRVNGLAGNDHITVGDVAALLANGGKGNDTVFGQFSDEGVAVGAPAEIKGGSGADALTGTGVLRGGKGNDSLFGMSETDSLFGDSGNDSLAGQGGDDFLLGGKGRDSLSGGFGDDQLFGMAGRDTLLGSDNDDTLYGGAARDTLNGGLDEDLLRFDDNDNVVTSFGTDTRREEKPTQTTKRINAITERADDFVDALK